MYPLCRRLSVKFRLGNNETIIWQWQFDQNGINLVFHSFFNFYDHRFSHISSFIHIRIWINIVFACVNIYISTSDLFPHSLTSFLSPHDSVMLMFSGLAKCLFNRIMYTYLITYYRFFYLSLFWKSEKTLKCFACMSFWICS